MGGEQNGGANALLLIFCSLETIRKVGGPAGAALAGCISVALLIAGVVWLIVWANEVADEVEVRTDASSANYSSAKGEPHSPDETSVNSSFWVNFILIFSFITFLTTPFCFYTPRRVVVYERPAPAETAAVVTVLPLLAISVEPEKGEIV